MKTLINSAELKQIKELEGRSYKSKANKEKLN